jgi:hypothetical protein
VPFSSFKDQSGYCAVEIIPELQTKSLQLYTGAHKKYIQTAFQTGGDQGCSSDDSHKLTSHIYVNVGNQRVHPFTTTYSILALSGKPNVSLFKPANSAKELIDVILA